MTESWDKQTWRENLHREPTLQQRANPWLNAPIINELTFSQRLGQCASAEWQGTWQAWLGPLVVGALVTSAREGLGAALTPAQRQILDQPLWWVPVHGHRAPDIALIGENDRIVLIIEVKGPRTQVQWTRATRLRTISQWAADPIAHAVRDWLAGLAPHAVEPHSQKDEPCCWAPKNAGAGQHTESLHQGDVYYSARDWVPPLHAIDDNCVWMALLPHQANVDKWRDSLTSSDRWVIASVPSLLTTLRTHLDDGRTTLTAWERDRLNALVVGGENLYRTALSRPW